MRRSTLVESFELRQEDPGALVEVMERLRRDRNGWVNLLAGVRPGDEPPPGSVLGAMFSGPVAHAPFCTWVPGQMAKRGLEPDRAGIQHASGPHAIARLADAGLALPERWRCSQDHVRRGLVLVLPDDAEAGEVASWLLRAGALLSTVALTGEWRAEVHLRR
ncbi:MAG: hypothetical protein M0035_14125 [Actinomycetota bacterium]|nr:hypothetical protein [Actinomycetota bacterium]